jgi:hypothetical protein
VTVTRRRGGRAAAMPDRDRLEEGVTALALRALVLPPKVRLAGTALV